MSANVGLSTPRGSGTSGYVQRNLSHLKPRDLQDSKHSLDTFQNHKQRKPDAEILEHERKRRIEVKVFEFRDGLEDKGVDEDEIDDQVNAYRKKLEQEEATNNQPDARCLKSHQVHDLARAKIEETERVRKALGIGKDYQEGSHWKRQEDRQRRAGVEQASGVIDEQLTPNEQRTQTKTKYRDRDAERHEDNRSRSPSP